MFEHVGVEEIKTLPLKRLVDSAGMCTCQLVLIQFIRHTAVSNFILCANQVSRVQDGRDEQHARVVDQYDGVTNHEHWRYVTCNVDAYALTSGRVVPDVLHDAIYVRQLRICVFVAVCTKCVDCIFIEWM